MTSVVADVLSTSSGQNKIVNQILIDDSADPSTCGAVDRVAPNSAIGWVETGGVWGPPLIEAAPPTQAQLLTYANAKAASLLAALNSYTAAAVTIKASATASTVADLLALSQWGAANPTAIDNWVGDDNSVTPVTGAQFVALSPLIGAYRKAVFGTTLAAVVAGINAMPPTISTTVQIDDPTTVGLPGWPANS